VSGGRGWSIRRHCLELWQGLVLQDMGEVDFHVFWKYWELTSLPNTSKFVLGPPDWSSGLLSMDYPWIIHGWAGSLGLRNCAQETYRLRTPLLDF